MTFLSTKGVPTLFWSSAKPLNFRPRVTTLAFLVVGLTVFGLGEALLINAGIGVSPWTVLAEGTSNVSGWSIGLSAFVVSVAVLLAWIPLRQSPGIGTVANAVIISLTLEFSLPYIPSPDGTFLQLVQVIAGILIVGIGSAIYLIANLGPGPRDGLMTGLQRVTGYPIGWVRSSIEITVVIAGWLLGGTVGVGTVMFALLIGPTVSACLFGFQRVFGKEAP
ncbi:MAG: hypothetical protein RIM33_06580 [Alphaproteobacteria bacterium]